MTCAFWSYPQDGLRCGRQNDPTVSTFIQFDPSLAASSSKMRPCKTNADISARLSSHTLCRMRLDRNVAAGDTFPELKSTSSTSGRSALIGRLVYQMGYSSEVPDTVTPNVGVIVTWPQQDILAIEDINILPIIIIGIYKNGTRFQKVAMICTMIEPSTRSRS